MSEGGVGQRWPWSYQTENWILYLTIPTDNCDIYRMCGAYGSCDITTAPACACLSGFEPKDARGWGSGDWSNGSLFVFFQKRKKHDHEQQESERQRRNYAVNYPNQSHEELEPPVFELSTIIEATDDFSIDNKLGEGGFGPVYKGLLGEGQEIAVKRLSKTSFQGVDEFKNEVICMAKLQHRNLVKLLGWCIQGAEKMLVYEYMTSKSLDLILFDEVKSAILDWPKRFSIVNEVARVLMYLHHNSRLRVIHRDLKASNIIQI